jgi:hypothetical protein
MIKSPEDTKNRRSIPQHNAGHIWQAYIQHHTIWGKIETISHKVRNEPRVSTRSTLIQYGASIRSQSNKASLFFSQWYLTKPWCTVKP